MNLKLAKSASIYTLANFTNAAIPFILLPVLTRSLKPEDYGVVSMFLLLVSIINPLISINLDGSIMRRNYEKELNDFPSYLGTCIILSIASSAFIGIIVFFFSNQIEKLTSISPKWLIAVFIVSFTQFLNSISLILFQVRSQYNKYSFFQISQTILNVSITLFLVLLIKLKWEGRILAQIISGLVFAILSIIILIKYEKIFFKWDSSQIKYALRFGLPIIPHALGGMMFTAVDRIFLTKIIGLEQTGNYTVAYQIGAILSIFTSAFNNAYSPWLFDNLNKNDNVIKKKIVKFTYLYFIILPILAVSLYYVFPYFVSYFVSNKFKTVNNYSFFILFAFVFQGMYFMVTNYIFYAKKTKLLALITISVGLIKIPITYYSIKIWGAQGVSVSFCLTFAIFFISTWILSSKVFPMPWFQFKNIQNG